MKFDVLCSKNMFKYFVIILFLVCFIGSSKASDSLNIKSKRFLIDLSCGVATPPLNFLSKSQDQGGSRNLECYISRWSEYNLSILYSALNFKRKNKRTNHSFGIGIGGGYSTFMFTEGISKGTYNSHTYSNAYYFSPSNINRKMSVGLASAFLNLTTIKEHFYISQSFGVRFMFYQGNQTNTYDEVVTSSGMATSPDSISASNPYGVYYFNHTSSIQHKDKFTFYNSANPFYNLELGAKARNFIPHIGFEMMYYSDQFSIVTDQVVYEHLIKNGLMLKLNLGLAFMF